MRACRAYIWNTMQKNELNKGAGFERAGVWVLAVLLAFSPASWAQTEATSPVYTFSIRKQIQPPILHVVEGSLAFVDGNGNHALDAEEQAELVFSLRNDGPGDGLGLRALVRLTGTTAGIQVDRETALPTVPKGATKEVRIPVRSTRATADGKLGLTVEVTEPQGFGVDPVQLECATVAFAAPRVAVVDHSLTGGGTLVKKQPFDLEVLIQNTGTGEARNVTAALRLPDGVFCLSGNDVATVGPLASGASTSVVFSCIINQTFTAEALALTVDVTESYREFGGTWKQSFPLNSALAATKLVVASRAEAPKAVEVASLASDVDRNIPDCNCTHDHRFAVVIGNEDYASSGADLDPQVNVDFATADARSMADYLERAFGVPRANIKLLTNATAGAMRQAITWLANNARASGGEAELFFYYSGHGLPAEADRTPYLIPVDVSGSSPQLGVALPDLYRELTAHPIARGTVILDACFSGGARNRELVAMKGVRVEPRADAIPSPLVVWASSSADESSGVFRDKQHGYFTYFLLKEIQTRGTTATYGDVFESARKAVDRATALAGSIQRPSAQAAPGLQAVWATWPLAPSLR